jgi:hypothetical protein
VLCYEMALALVACGLGWDTQLVFLVFKEFSVGLMCDISMIDF